MTYAEAELVNKQYGRLSQNAKWGSTHVKMWNEGQQNCIYIHTSTFDYKVAFYCYPEWLITYAGAELVTFNSCQNVKWLGEVG